jgi:hypothetical protein
MKEKKVKINNNNFKVRLAVTLIFNIVSLVILFTGIFQTIENFELKANYINRPPIMFHRALFLILMNMTT